jgi:2-oxoisovalerate dehydrogenase E2 component (dihydrolipoyl transacylase)
VALGRPAGQLQEVTADPFGEVPAGAESRVGLTPMRRAIAEHMVRSLATSPHGWSLFEVDVTRLVAGREQLAPGFVQRHGVPLTYLPLIIPLVAECVRRHPLVNSSWSEDGIRVQPHLNLGVAVSVDQGLVVPIIPDADRLSVPELAHAVADLARRARSRRLRAEDVRGGTFTLNNTGVIGAVTSRPIINQPQAAILTTQRIVRRPVVLDDAIVPRDVMHMAMSFDHRILDAFSAGAFLADVKAKVEAWEPPDSI